MMTSETPVKPLSKKFKCLAIIIILVHFIVLGGVSIGQIQTILNKGFELQSSLLFICMVVVMSTIPVILISVWIKNDHGIHLKSKKAQILYVVIPGVCLLVAKLLLFWPK